MLYALGDLIVLFNHTVNNTANFVVANTLSPAKIFNRVVGTFTASMTTSLESISTNGATRESSVARSVINGICGMSKMIDTSMRTFLVVADMVTWGCRKAKATGSKCFGECLECDSRQSKGQTEERGDNTTEGMTSQPDVGIWIEFSDIVV